MPAIHKSLARSRSTRFEQQQQHPSKQQTGHAGGLKSKKSQPPLKRRRILHHSSTGTSDSDDEPASSSPETDQSSEHDDNERDSDYVNDISAEEDQTTPRAHRQQDRRRVVVPGSSSSDTSMSDSDTSSSSGDAASHVKKALSSIEVNALRKGQRNNTARRNGWNSSENLQKEAKLAVKKLRRDVPTLHNRYPPSPVKMLPKAGRRGFQVHPDLPNPFSYNIPSASTSTSSASRHRANGARTTATIQAGLRRFAGRMIQKVNTMGLSGTSKMSDSPAMVRPHSKGREQFSTSMNGKRKRDDQHRDSSRVKPSSLRRTSTDKRSQKRNSAQHTAEERSDLDFSSLQPIRRTRSLARQIEQLGVPASQTYDDDVDEDEAPVASTSTAAFRRNSGKGSRKHITETDDDDTESVERSIAEMSLDEITENGDEDEDDQEEGEAEQEQEDADLLNQASLPQLHRLRKDHLLRLVASLQHEDDEQDRSDFTKDMLVKMIMDSRDAQAENEEEQQEEDSDNISEKKETLPSPKKRSSTSNVLGSRHGMRRTSANTNVPQKVTSPKRQYRSLPASSSPQRPQLNPNGRSRSFSRLIDSSSSDSSSSDNEHHFASSQASSSPQQRRRRTASGLGMGRPKVGGSSEKTPGRLRSGKLRQPSTVVSSSDAEKENRYQGSHTVPGMRRTTSHASIYEDEDEAPTPIARRTRHRRNMSTVSAASSAGYGDDEEVDGMANREYRLRKVSLPRRAASKRNSVIEVSEEEQQEETEEDELDTEDIGEGSIIDHEEDNEEEEEEEEAGHEDPIDLSTATKTGLLRLRRDALIQMCRERDLDEAGTKADLATALLDWWAEHGQVEEEEEGDADQSEQSTSSDADDVEEEEDEDFEPADVSMESVSSATSVESSSTISSTPRSDATTRVARRETKTQALAKLSNKRQSYDKASRDKPLLLKSDKSKAKLVHSPRPDTPPGSGDVQDNDLELDLESLNLLDKEIHPDKLKRGDKIGSGGFKDVYEGRYRNVKVALADIRGHLTENDIKELGLLRDLRHENIVRFIGVSIPSQSDVPVTIVTELCSNGDLFDYIRNTPAPPLEKILSIMLNVAKGLEYLHKRKPATIHRDMKSSNVLVTAKGVAKIADFGLARVKNSTRSIIKSLVGTVNWQAPELWVPHPRYNEKVDVYSAAMVFWECLQWHLSQKRYPFEGMNEHAIYQEVGQKQMRPSTATMRRQWGGDILDLVEKMWAQSPAQRPGMTEVVKELETLLHAEKARARAAR